MQSYTYIGLDFETTGLDITKDEPIQIGIVAIDANGKVTDSFQSLIKPNKKTDELKHIVGFITGLSITDLESAPTRDEILQQIQKFFDEFSDDNHVALVKNQLSGLQEHIMDGLREKERREIEDVLHTSVLRKKA